MNENKLWFCVFGYWVPVGVTSQLKVVKVPVFDTAIKIKVAWIDAHAFKTACAIKAILNKPITSEFKNTCSSPIGKTKPSKIET